MRIIMKPINLKAFHNAVRQAFILVHGYRGPDRRKFATLPADRWTRRRDDLTGWCLIDMSWEITLLHLECCKRACRFHCV